MSASFHNTKLSFLRQNFRRLLPIVIVSLGSLYAAEPAQYPDGFRRWVHVGTGVILPSDNPQLKGEDGMHHIFANSRAVEGYATGRFPDGSVIVYELRDAQQKTPFIVEGERRRVDVMIRESARYASTGGWRFERFWASDATKNAVPDSGSACFQCHTKAQGHGFVFSRLQ
jgi:hypothetical protein